MGLNPAAYFLIPGGFDLRGWSRFNTGEDAMGQAKPLVLWQMQCLRNEVLNLGHGSTVFGLFLVGKSGGLSEQSEQKKRAGQIRRALEAPAASPSTRRSRGRIRKDADEAAARRAPSACWISTSRGSRW